MSEVPVWDHCPALRETGPPIIASHTARVRMTTSVGSPGNLPTLDRHIPSGGTVWSFDEMHATLRNGLLSLLAVT